MPMALNLNLLAQFSSQRFGLQRRPCLSAGWKVTVFQGGLVKRALRPSHAGAPTRSRWALRCMSSSSDADANKGKEEIILIPAKPKSAVGELLAYYRDNAPHLLQTAIEDQFENLRNEKEKEGEQEIPEGGTEKELVLYRRIEEVRQQEMRTKVEDLLYVCVLEKFSELGVQMLPRIDDFVHTELNINLRVLMEGVHSKEAVELVKEHVLGVLGPASTAFTNTMIKMSKLQAAQVYAASLMFGYFLRRVDTRFQLEKALGTLPQSTEDAMNRLEHLFSQAASMDETDDPDAADLPAPPSPSYAEPSPSSTRPPSDSAATTSSNLPVARKKNPLRAYVEKFDQQTLVETARVVSLEGAAVVEHHTSSLFGNIKELQKQMQEAVGQDARSMDEVMQRIQDAVAQGAVESLTMTVGTQRRAVLEAVAFGVFLRDVETMVDTNYGLLTPAPMPGTGGNGPNLLM